MKLLLTLKVLQFGLFINLILAQQNPLKDPNVCGRPTCKGYNNFRYKTGILHRYKYNVDISSLFKGTSKNESTLYIDSEVTLEFLSPCDGILNVKNLKLNNKLSKSDLENTEHEQSEIFSASISEYSLRFAFNDGFISEICPSVEEKTWVLNFKRGLLSMLHNTMKRFDLDHNAIEDDVKGQCYTEYRVVGPNGTSLIIEKIKDLTSCEHRTKLHTMVQSTAYNFRPNHQTGNLLKSSSMCNMSIDHRIYNDIRCEETHLFEPFSNQDAGATTIVKQRLILIDEIEEIIEKQPSIERRESLFYNQVSTSKPTSGEMKISRDLIKKLCKMRTDDVQTIFSDLFTKFIHSSRRLSYPALQALYKHSTILCETGKKHVLDSLPYLGSNAGVSLMKDIILKDGVSKTTVRDWMFGIALISRPEENMLKSLFTLLQQKYEDAHITLAISSITHTYCVQNSNCETNEYASKIINYIEQRTINAYRSKRKDRENVESFMIGVKAMANIGVASVLLKDELKLMIEDESVNIDLRVAAVDVHRRLPCDESRSYFEKLFRNQMFDSEIRIASYLQIMRCPNYIVIAAIQNSLEVEEVNQVGSFIWSHLQNLLESSIPSRVEIQSLLGDRDLVKKFSSDVRKFSHNYEGSIFFEEFNTGGSYDSNIIFSPSSYIPRSAMLNMTVDLFGKSINVLEVYGRIEGFEHYFESIFGPKGNYSAKNVKRKLSKFRFERSAAPNENDVLKSQIDELPDMLENNFGPPRVSLGMKVFGNDLKYATFNGEEEIKDAVRTLNPIDHIKRILSGKEINYSKATMFMDASLSVPTSAGLPLTLNAVGTSSINMKIQGELNALHFMKTRELDLNGTFRPDLALDITGSMAVDAYYAGTGIKLKTSLYTSSAVDGNLKIRGKKIVSVKFSLPKKTTEIFGAKSELIVMEGDNEVEQAGIIRNRVSESTCSWPSVEQTVGLKFCMDYHFPNVTKINNATYFILAGSSGFRLSLQKSDPTTKTYILEYKWEDTHNSSYISLTFDTPGSKVKRLLGANLTLDLHSHNLTLLMQSTAGSVVAKGKYKNTFAEKYIQLELDVNNNKKLDTLLSLETEQIRNGHLYKPKIFLGVNNDRVAELEGTLKWVEKAGVSQCDVDLKFQTKRLTSKLFGYISKTDSSVGVDFKIDYAFVNTKSQWIKFYFVYANLSPSTYYSFFANSTLQTTAYPQFNYESSLRFKKSDIKTEGSFNFHCSPYLKEAIEDDKQKLSVDLFFIYQRRSNTTNLKVNAGIKRPISNIDLETKLLYKATGHDKNMKISIHYAKDKDIIVTIYWYYPRHALKRIEGFLNVTIPTFKPLILDGKLREKIFDEYVVEMFASWFTGHNLTLHGVYQDKCVPSIKDHHLKMIVKSPSFVEINSTLHYFHSDEEFKIDLRADQNEDKYGIYLKHNETSKMEFNTEAKFKYKSKVYGLTSTVSLKDRKQIKIELYFDQWRNIIINMWAHGTSISKTAGFQLAWDANRDPNKIVLITLNYKNPESYDYQADFRITYPDRTIHGLFLFQLKRDRISTSALLTWDTTQSLGIKFAADYRSSPELLISVESDVLTPFEGWKKTSFNGTFHHRGNMYRANGRVYWQRDQHISIDLFGDYATAGSALKCNFSGSLVSTVYDTLSLSTSFNHSHTTTEADTDLFIMYHPKQIIDISSSWKLRKDENAKNVTGTVTLVSPFKGFNKGLLVSKIYVSNSRDLRGVADLDLDHKKFTATIEGHFRRLSDNMFVVNVTTPIEKFKKFNGRFGFSEIDRHFVAMIRYPTGRLGSEIITDVIRIDDFNIKIDICTPIEFLQEILLVGLLKTDKVDFRAGWNSLVAGFAGVWHYVNITDFEYSYKIYTPIEGLEENGIVAKLIFKEGLDFEVSVKLSENRAGIIMLVRPKDKILKNLGIRTQSIYASKLSSDVNKRRGPVNKKVDEKDPFSWMGLLQLDLILWPTINATIDIDQKANVYVILGKLQLPNNTIDIKDEYEFFDALTMKNNLVITTTYVTFKEITSDIDMEVVIGEELRLRVNFDYLNQTKYLKTGAFVYLYKSDEEDEEERIYNGTLHVHTPLESFPLLDIHSFLSLEESTYSTNFTMVTNQSDIAFVGQLVTDEGLIDANAAFHVLSPFANLPAVKFSLMKDFNEKEKRFICHLDMEKYLAKSLKVAALWSYDSIKKFKANLDIETPFKGFERTIAGSFVNITKEKSIINGQVTINTLNVMANATVNRNIINATGLVDVQNKKNHIFLNGALSDNDKERRFFNGELKTDTKKFDIVGFMDFNDNLVTNVQLELRPKDNGSPTWLQYRLQPQPTGYAVRSEVRQDQHHITLEGHLTAKHTYNWDLNIRVDTTHPNYKNFALVARAESTDKDKSININVKTPFRNFENSKVGVSLTDDNVNTSYGHAFFVINESKGELNATWAWIIMENMSVKLIGNYETTNYTKDASITVYYLNPNRTFESVNVGGNVALNKMWNTGANIVLKQGASDGVKLEGNVLLPKPNPITHYFVGKLQTDSEFTKLNYLAKYNNSISNNNYGSNGKISRKGKEYFDANIGVDWKKSRVNNYVNLKRGNGSMELLYKLRTPKFKQETLVTKLMYKRAKRHHAECKVFYPFNRLLAEARVDFQEFSNMNGTVNVTTPYKGLNFTSVHFVTETSTTLNNRYIKISWPNDNAFLNSTRTTKIDAVNSGSVTKGLLYVEGPVRTRHNASVNYMYSEKPLNMVGRATLVYNNKEILQGKYNCNSELKRDNRKDKIHIELKNEWLPVGADYVHVYDLSEDILNRPTVDYKSLHGYHLTNRTRFNVTGELKVIAMLTGKELYFTAKHANRTVKLQTMYTILEKRFIHSSLLNLSPTVWISYNLGTNNKTKDESSEAREVQIDVSYPRRNFTAFGSYNMSNSSLSSEMSLVWDKEERTVQAEFDWKRDISHPNRHEVQLLIKHPSFEKNVSISGSYETTKTKYVDVDLLIDYALDPQRLVSFQGVIENKSDKRLLNYTYYLLATHPATNLNLEANGGIYYKTRWFYTSHFVNYTHNLVPPQPGEVSTKIDVDSKEIEFKRNDTHDLTYFWGKYDGNFPIYTTNITVIEKETSSNGEFYLNLNERLVRLELNLTEDGSQSLHMFGLIPDARNVVFDVYRDYDDIHVSDISYFLRLNHSRLIVSTMRWRPELKENLQDLVRNFTMEVYSSSLERAEFWRHYIRSQAQEVIQDIWDDVKPLVQNCTDDIRHLRVLKEDFDDFKTYLNNSYQANDFYIREIVGIFIYISDELSLKSHFENLPVIVNEIWEKMGESGKKIHKSILWAIEKIKMYYKEAMAFLNGLIQEDSLEHLSEALNQLVEKYDNFIKDMHIAFIRYMEQLWKQAYTMFLDNWHKALAAIEPTFIKYVHYLETIVWNASKEFLDFVYMHRNELMESVYFTKFTNFTHDVDKFYRDMTGNDTITNIYKYTKVVYNFLKEKYFKLIPFAEELTRIVNEIINELNELKKLPTVAYLLEKYNEMERKLKWFCDYFELDVKFQRFIALIHLKLSEIKQNALQAENKYREAKTKFIFEPADGIMHLEQKLPMSWHAFNETPKFEEIPEYKAIYDLQKYFKISKIKFNSFYRDFKFLMEPAEWLPPFKAQAMLAGSQYYITFDRVFYDFEGSCSYLLASDFLDRNFSIAISHKENYVSSHELLLLINNTVININLFKNSVTINNNPNTRLPAEIGETYLYQESEILTIKSELGFMLQCNMKFDICILELSGWYFGKTAGLWGTMNNEPTDDLLASTNVKLTRNDIDQFASTWKLNKDCNAPRKQLTSKNITKEMKALCHSFFSEVNFGTCFPRVPYKPYFDMCLNSVSEDAACTSVVAYVNMCSYADIILRIPEGCVRCNLVNGSAVPEGKFVTLEDNAIPKSADIVFIVETKSCNENLRHRRNMDLVIESLHKELMDLNINDSRYGVVLFGGNGVYDKPRSVLIDSSVFAGYHSIPTYFDNIPVGNGSADIFGALVYASKLIFRPGVAKTFIVIPCSKCKESNMKLDYSVLQQLLLENDITLHILMNEEFQFQKTRMNKILFGIDYMKAYSKKDAEKLIGDADLKKQVHLPKTSLGFCTPLGLETNGTIFTAKKLEGGNKSMIRKFATVFGKRVAASSVPRKCKTCECTSDDTGISYMECFHCGYPTAVSDYATNDDKLLSIIQPFDDYDLQEE